MDITGEVTMKKKMLFIKKFILVLLCILGTFMINGCFEPIKDGYFMYYKRKFKNEDVYLIGLLTEEGRNQPVLVVPTTFKGKKTTLGVGFWGPRGGSISSKNLKLFIPQELECYVDTVYFEFLLKNKQNKLIILSNDADKVKTVEFRNPDNAHVSSYLYDEKDYSKYVNKANVSYSYNYEDSPNNGYYWIDDYDGEVISFIPPAPTRAGYEFLGWYKEKEGINKWDFEKDIVPSKIHNEVGNYMYQETILYAKWI